tara:strand:- start:1094 stop:2503 length:1410 start_codon:yes stop_codon:yes gene_type:complete
MARFIVVLIGLLLVNQQALAISFDEARHLLARTGFGSPSPEEIDKILPLSYEAAVDQILDGMRDKAVTPFPNFLSNPLERPTVRNMDAATRQDYQQRNQRDRKKIRFWWIQEMLDTPSPFTEHMVLFWHNHFVSEISKVQFGQWIHEQNASFRKYAIGDFRKLLIEVSIGPAMMIYLDASKNKKNKPNENFAREIMELFTLGEGQGYTEEDIRESSRAYTGWRINNQTSKFEFQLGNHDPSNKTVLGKTGNFDGIDVMEIILEQPRVAEFLAEKLWREFVSLEPNPSETKRLAKIIRDHKYNLKPMLKAMFMSRAFRDPGNYGSLIKSPVELTIGTLRLLDLKPPEVLKVWWNQKNLGQDLFDPPDVKGWRGGTAWMTSTTTLRRSQFLKAAYNGIGKFRKDQDAKAMGMKPPVFGLANPWRLQKREHKEPGYLKKLMLAIDPVMQKKFTGKQRRVILNLLVDPAYQVK